MSHYKTLGIEPSASQEQIKAAYRKLVKQHHPDRGGDTEQFKKINEAYDILKDSKSRDQYDNPSQFANAQFQSSYNDPRFEEMFEALFRRSDQRQQNRDIKLSITLTLEEIFTGKTLNIFYRLGNGSETTANISIPAGIEHGEALKFSGLGDNSIPNSPRGNLIVFVKILQHSHFERNGNNLKQTIKINTIELILGKKIDITTISGNKISVNVPAGTHPGTILSISEHGMPDHRTGRIGNLHLVLKGTTPNVTDKELIERIKTINDAINTGS